MPPAEEQWTEPVPAAYETLPDATYAELPAFRPLDWPEVPALAQPEPEQQAATEFLSPVEIPAPVQIADEPEFVSEPAPLSEIQLSGETDFSSELAEAVAVDQEPISDLPPLPEFRPGLPPLAELQFESPTPETPVTAAQLPEGFEADRPSPEAAFEALVEDLPPAVHEEQLPEPELAHADADGNIAEQAELPDYAPAETVIEDLPVAGVMETVDAAPGEEVEPVVVSPAEEPTLSPMEDAAVVADSAPVAETKSSTSEMAGRVVDAMLKTISTAIYAKPSASERAAFLREMAAMIQQEGEEAGDRSEDAEQAGAIQAIGPEPMPEHSGEPESAPAEMTVAEALAQRIGTATPLLKKQPAEQEDPFARPAMPSRLIEPKPAETAEADEESGELAMTLLDMMSGGTGSLPHERTLASDTLLRILPRIPVKQLLSVVDRVAIMEAPPPLLVAKLIRDARPEVVAPLLERCSHISDLDLMNAAPGGEAPKLRMIARRRVLSTVLSDYLIATGEPGVLLTLIRNPGASLSHEAFFKLADYAAKFHALLAPLATRADLPPPVAFELFWHVPQELRRFIFSRFLTDSETLNKILRITLSTHGNEGVESLSEGRFPPREAVDNAIGQAAAYRLDEAAQSFAEMAAIARETSFRILSDREGEPLTVLLKALGCNRAKFEEILTRLRLGDAGLLRADRNPEELQTIFDSLSFNKARILLTYWDWYMRKAGPYAPHN